MKRYYIEYESDEIVCGSNRHHYGYASTVKTAKDYIRRCRKSDAKHNPRNFKIFDTESAEEYATIVHEEE